MKRIKCLAFAVLVTCFYSCSNKEFNPTFKSDIGNNGEWINMQTVGKFGGHEDEYCSKVDSLNEYSYGFQKLMSEISPSTIKKVKVSCWVKLENLTKITSLVVSLDSNNKSIFWMGHDINKFVNEPNKWFKVEVVNEFPKYKPEATTVGIYVWNNNKNVAFIDDIEIKFLEK
ncbi:MAG: hypothetical protein PHD97_02025 [Bacteroidales bacterium]|nr:hypothetical protein [Bacteroidales bacterium]